MERGRDGASVWFVEDQRAGGVRQVGREDGRLPARALDLEFERCALWRRHRELKRKRARAGLEGRHREGLGRESASAQARVCAVVLDRLRVRLSKGRDDGAPLADLAVDDHGPALATLGQCRPALRNGLEVRPAVGIRDGVREGAQRVDWFHVPGVAVHRPLRGCALAFLDRGDAVECRIEELAELQV